MKNKDLRYLDMLRRLRLFNDEQLERILSAKPEEICLDTYNYDVATQRYCPIAIALDIPNQILAGNIIPCQEEVAKMIRNQAGEAWGSVKGISGEFYRQNRYEDLRSLCMSIIKERNMSEVPPWDRDWEEDFELENGHYFNICCKCEKEFIGHKKRVICKICINTSEQSGDESNK